MSSSKLFWLDYMYGAVLGLTKRFLRPRAPRTITPTTEAKPALQHFSRPVELPRRGQRLHLARKRKELMMLWSAQGHGNRAYRRSFARQHRFA